MNGPQQHHDGQCLRLTPEETRELFAVVREQAHLDEHGGSPQAREAVYERREALLARIGARVEREGTTTDRGAL